jgi:hypothetical protein
MTISNIIGIDFEKKRIQNDIDAYKNLGQLPDVLTSRRFLVKHNSIYECVVSWAHTLDMVGDPIWSMLIDDYITYARDTEINIAADILRQLDKETKVFLAFMKCKSFAFDSTTIKGDATYDSQIFTLGRDLEFISPKVRFGIELTALEKFKISLYVDNQREILDNINDDLKTVNDIITRYKHLTYLTWTMPMYQCLQCRSSLDHLLQTYVSSAEAINSVLPYSIK